MAINIADPRTLWKVVEDQKEPKSFFTDTFFPDGPVMQTEIIDIDYVDQNRNELPAVSPIDDGIVLVKEGFNRRTFAAPYYKAVDVITGTDLAKSMAGEDPYNPTGRAAKLAFLQGRAVGKCRTALARIKEIQASRVLQTGITTIYKHVEGQASPVAVAQVDWVPAAFRTTHYLTLTGTDLWSDASIEILEQLATYSRLAMIDCGIRPDTLVVGTGLVKYLMNDTKVKAYLDNRRYNMGSFDPQVYDNRATWMGELRYADLAVQVWCYSELYTDATGVSTPMLNAKKYILGAKAAGTSMAYGAIQNLAAVSGGEGGALVDSARMFVKSWMADNGSSLTTQIESAPCACMTQPKAFICAQALT